jgi:general secretion pathway protein J
MNGQLSQRGFTLIEVLVALALFALVGTILIESLRVGAHAWQHVTRSANQGDEITRAQEFLRLRLESIVPPAVTDSHASTVALAGESDSLEFLSATHDDAAMTRYQVRKAPAPSHDIEIRYRRVIEKAAGLEAQQWSAEPLVGNAVTLSFQYWDDQVSPGIWVDHWTSATKLPRLVEVDIQFADGDRRRWPLFFAEPRMDTPAACVFDVVSKRCREGI